MTEPQVPGTLGKAGQALYRAIRRMDMSQPPLTPSQLWAGIEAVDVEARADALAQGEDWEATRRRLGWPTPMHMHRVAAALDVLAAGARYGDVLRWVADACDAALEARTAPTTPGEPT